MLFRAFILLAVIEIADTPYNIEISPQDEPATAMANNVTANGRRVFAVNVAFSSLAHGHNADDMFAYVMLMARHVYW